jgi:integrase
VKFAGHTDATVCRLERRRLDIVSRQLGHATIATTADIYTHDDKEAALEAAELMARMIGGRGEG